MSKPKDTKLDRVRLSEAKWRRATARAHQAHSITEKAARVAFERERWPDGVACPRCGGTDVRAVPSGCPQPWACRDCVRTFSVRHGTIMAASNRPLTIFYIGAQVYDALREVAELQAEPFIELVADPPPLHSVEFTWARARRWERINQQWRNLARRARRWERINQQWRNLARLWHSLSSVEGDPGSTPESRRAAAERKSLLPLNHPRREPAEEPSWRAVPFEAVLRAEAARLGVAPDAIAREAVVASLLAQGYTVGVDGYVDSD